jgi:undecaprenyl-diphosphatase
VVWALAVLLVFTACFGRVWAGVHWPSDVLGGFLLGLGWSAFVLWLPERWLPQPSRRWLRLGAR